MMNFLSKIQKRLRKKESGDYFNAYQKYRNVRENVPVCFAPYNNMYFTSEGKVSACWLKTTEMDNIKGKTIKEIWDGPAFKTLREKIKNKIFEGACTICKKNIENNNFEASLSHAYDIYPPDDYPQMMEFELSNTCNFECVMCNGLLSSSIRRNRENLDPLPMAYDESFVEQLEEFIPHLKEARFNGGEPLLINIYYDIWEKIQKINPEVKIVVATNGSILNKKVKNALNKGRFHLNVSIDGMTQETYESVRIRGDFERLLKNINFFKIYCFEKNTTLCLLFNPMIKTWKETIDFLNYGNKLNLPIWLNTVVHPYEESLRSLSKEELKDIIDYLNSVKPKLDFSASNTQKHNVKIYDNFVNHIIGQWYHDTINKD